MRRYRSILLGLAAIGLAGCAEIGLSNRIEDIGPDNKIGNRETVVYGRVQVIENGTEVADFVGLTNRLEIELVKIQETPLTITRTTEDDGSFTWVLDGGTYLMTHIKRARGNGTYKAPVRGAFRASQSLAVQYLGTVRLALSVEDGAPGVWVKEPAVRVDDNFGADTAQLAGRNDWLAQFAAKELMQVSDALPARAAELDDERGMNFAVHVLGRMGLVRF